VQRFSAGREAALAEAKPSATTLQIELARRIVARALTLAMAGTPARAPRFRPPLRLHFGDVIHA